MLYKALYNSVLSITNIKSTLQKHYKAAIRKYRAFTVMGTKLVFHSKEYFIESI
jgi:hypothetical protein